MSFRSLLVFVHVLGAAGLFAAMGIEVAALRSLRRAATRAEVGTALGLVALPARIGGPAMAVTVASGIWLMALAWGDQPWITATFAAIAAIIVLTGRRLQRLRSAFAMEAGEELSSSFRSRVDATVASLRLRIALGAGIVALMTIKPGAAGSGAILGAAVAAGLAAAFARRTARSGNALLAANLATLALFAGHHIYGAIRYGTPWRHHAAVLAIAIGAGCVAASSLARRRPGTVAARVGEWALLATSVGFTVVLVGGFEGLYNHVVKDALFLAGAPRDVLLALFPPPRYELPDDALFEVSGVLQVVPAALTARAAVRFARAFRKSRAASTGESAPALPASSRS